MQPGDTVLGNSQSGRARGDHGIVVSTEMAPPRTVKVCFEKLGFWLLRPDELSRSSKKLDPAFRERALAGKALPGRREMYDLLARSLEYTEGDLNEEILQCLRAHDDYFKV